MDFQQFGFWTGGLIAGMGVVTVMLGMWAMTVLCIVLSALLTYGAIRNFE